MKYKSDSAFTKSHNTLFDSSRKRERQREAVRSWRADLLTSTVGNFIYFHANCSSDRADVDS